MKDSPSAPPAPDYAGAALAQGAANKETAIAQAKLNNPVKTYTPYGTQTVSWGGAEGIEPTVTQELNPAEAQLLQQGRDVRQRLGRAAQIGSANVQNVLSSPFQYQGPSIQTSVPDQNVSGAPTLANYGQAGTVGQNEGRDVINAGHIFNLGLAQGGPAAAQGIASTPNAGLFGMAGRRIFQKRLYLKLWRKL